jgi:hypothetical protein
VHLQLHLTDDTQLHALGSIAGSDLIAEVFWTRPIPDSRLDEGTLWGTLAMLRRLAALATQAAIQAEEEACWQAHQVATAHAKGGWPEPVAGGRPRLRRPQHPHLPCALAPPHPEQAQPGLLVLPRGGL